MALKLYRNFEEWMEGVEKELDALIGVRSTDIPDFHYHDDYDDEFTPRATAMRAIKEAGGF